MAVKHITKIIIIYIIAYTKRKKLDCEFSQTKIQVGT